MINKILFRGAVPTTAGTAEYTVPTGYRTIAREINICNTTSSSLTVSIHFVASGGSADTTNAIIYGATIQGNKWIDLSGEHILNVGDFIQIVGSASGLSMYGSGEEVRL